LTLFDLLVHIKIFGPLVVEK